MAQGKRYKESAKLVDRTKLYTAKEALELIEKMPKAKFDETARRRIRRIVKRR